ncbi:MAG: ABC transporter ATP-binding protein [Pseudomonadota bacterium]
MSYLSVEGVCKSFSGFKALDNVTLSASKGSILAVLGENGAGKTTLMNVLYGLYRPDQGRIAIDGRTVTLDSPRDAIRNKIGMIHQHFHLAKALTATENILVGMGAATAALELRTHTAQIQAMSAAFGFDVDLASPVWKLPMGMQQRVEILKALYRKAEILVLDEPTSVLAPDEIASLLTILRKLRDAGTTIVFVTHKLEEVFSTADQVAVMRQGSVVATSSTRDITPQDLSSIMVGHEIAATVATRHGQPGRTRLQVCGLSARNERGATALDKVSFELRSGEILGITGVDGNGQAELAEVIAGLRPSDAGQVLLDGVDISPCSMRQRIHTHKISFVPEDRHGTGLVLDHPVWKNFYLRNYYTQAIAPRGVLKLKAMRSEAMRLAHKYDCRLSSIDQPVSQLSGGNQQKVILAREIEAGPRLLIVMQATKGLDIGAIAFVQKKLIEQRDAGVAVLYISTELEHVLEIADRVGVMYRGRITGELNADQVSTHAIGMLMSGITQEKRA